MVATSNGLLALDDPSPVIVENPRGSSPFLLIGDHAGNSIPRRLGTLGLEAADRTRHIAWDIGTAALGQRLASALDAVFVRQAFSRLVIDCNRAPAAADAMPETSDGSVIPGNRGLTSAEREARIAGIHAPYQDAIGAELERRKAASEQTILVSLHSFTPRMNGVDRPWDVGVLYDGGDTTFAETLLQRLSAEPALTVGDNEPYRMDGTDHTVPRHAFPAGLPYAEIEVRQDHLASAAGILRWCGILEAALHRSAQTGDT